MLCPETSPINPGSLPSVCPAASTVGVALEGLIKVKPSSTSSSASCSPPVEDRRVRSASNEAGNILCRNNISILLSAKGAKVVLKESYDLFSKLDVEHSLRAEVQPLISFDLSTKTMIKFESIVGLVVHMFTCSSAPVAAVRLSVEGTEEQEVLLAVFLAHCEAGEAEAALACLDVHPHLLDAVDAHGWNGLINASKCGHIHLVRELLARGASTRSTGKHSALRGAAMFGFSEVCRVLLAAGHEVDALSTGNRTALMGAAMHGSAEVSRNG